MTAFVYNDKLRVCFDTCHTSDSGYDIIHHFDDVIDEFDRLIGKRSDCRLFTFNDSKKYSGSRKRPACQYRFRTYRI